MMSLVLDQQKSFSETLSTVLERQNKMMKEIFRLQTQVSDLVGVSTTSQTSFSTIETRAQFVEFNNVLENEQKRSELVI